MFDQSSVESSQYFNAAKIISLFMLDNRSCKTDGPILLSWDVIMRLCQVQSDLNNSKLSLSFAYKKQPTSLASKIKSVFSKVENSQLAYHVHENKYALGLKSDEANKYYEDSFYIDVEAWESQAKEESKAPSLILMEAMKKRGFQLHKDGFWFYNASAAIPKLFDPRVIQMNGDNVAGKYAVATCSMIDGSGDLKHLQDFLRCFLLKYSTAAIPMIELEMVGYSMDNARTIEAYNSRNLEKVLTLLSSLQQELKLASPILLSWGANYRLNETALPQINLSVYRSSDEDKLPSLINVKSSVWIIKNSFNKICEQASGNLMVSNNKYFPSYAQGVPTVYIAEHYGFTCNSEVQGAANYQLGLSAENCIGIKVKELLPRQSGGEILPVLSQEAPDFYSRCLFYADGNPAKATQNSYIKMYVYSSYALKVALNYISFLACNETLPKNHNIIIHFSSDSLNDLRNKFKQLQREFKEDGNRRAIGWKDNLAKTQIGEVILDFFGEQTEMLFTNQNPHYAQSKIILAVGYPLNNVAYAAFMRMVTAAYVCGDNTFEDIVKFQVPPIFILPSWTNYKHQLFSDLQKITNELYREGKLDKGTKDNFSKILDLATIEKVLCSSNEEAYDLIMKSELHQLNLMKVTQAWPIICDRIFQHHNVYNQIDKILETSFGQVLTKREIGCPLIPVVEKEDADRFNFRGIKI